MAAHSSPPGSSISGALGPGPCHVIVPFAQLLSPVGQEVWRRWGPNDLPQLRELLATLQPQPPDLGDEMSLTAPHERVIARELGWDVRDGIFPWAAREVALQGWGDPTRPWARITPVHWALGTEQVRMAPPQTLVLDDTPSRTLFDAVRPLFESEGFEWHYAGPLSWFTSHPSLDGLPCASLDRVAGRSVDPWMSQDPRSRLLRRLQNEVQMLLYRHPLNEARESQGLMPVNSFWMSDCGSLPVPQVHLLPGDVASAAPSREEGLRVEEGLRSPALQEDGLAWQEAWKALDDEVLADLVHLVHRGHPVRLTLCGERGSQTWQLGPTSGLSGVKAWILRRWRGSGALRELETL